jgi:hypothetical protein
MSYPARGPSVLGIDGKASAARRRRDTLKHFACVGRGGRMSYPARGFTRAMA